MVSLGPRSRPRRGYSTISRLVLWNRDNDCILILLRLPRKSFRFQKSNQGLKGIPNACRTGEVLHVLRTPRSFSHANREYMASIVARGQGTPEFHREYGPEMRESLV